ncbi:MAG: hypothetical protein HY674_16200 [Chloroflexi bacterium]|nr:hypothetical protein [Chloroflexota bacterium]
MPEQTLFSNDGPLGVISCQANSLPSGFWGAWQNLNWLGIEFVSSPPNLTDAFSLLTGPLVFSKYYAPVALLFLGLCAWFFFRQLRFSPAVCLLVGLAASLHTNTFSNACWGLPSRALTLGAIFLALAALHGATQVRPRLKTALAGMAVGLAIMEGFDVGALFSLYVAAFVLFQTWHETTGHPMRKLANGGLRTLLVAFCAAFISAQTLSTLVGTQVKGVAGLDQDAAAKQKRWDVATMWSLPKVETLRVIIPGLFGYRMDTPDGGNYWGGVGQQPGKPQSRHSGSGEYAGVLVVLVALWGLFRSTRPKDNPFSETERKTIKFWAVAAGISLLLAFGRHTPFYQFIYQLPYFSTIRNPIKFMHPFELAILVLFGYGLQGLGRRYLERNLVKANSLSEQLKTWWATVPAFDKKWTLGSIAVLALSLMGWLLYFSLRSELERHLHQAGFPGELGAAIARFSLVEVGWFLFFLTLSVLVVTVILSGALSGPRAKWAGLLMGALLVTDLSRANLPWIIYYNYKEKYASNPVIDLLREKPFERRVAVLPFQVNQQFADFQRFYYLEWLGHLFQFYNIQSLDVIQMPREPVDWAPYNKAFSKAPLRLWQLTNTRYLLGVPGVVEALNEQLDPVKRRFRVQTAFNLVKAGSDGISAQISTNGTFAILEFTGALPRAQLFASWRTNTNDEATLQELTNPAFDPQQTVLVSGEIPAPPSSTLTNPSAGTVEITHYEPKRIELSANASLPSVLLLNDRIAPNWYVSVDGAPSTLLRCNYWMRGVYLKPGPHTVVFWYQPPITGLYVSLAAIAVGLVLLGVLAFASNGAKVSAAPAEPVPANPKPKAEKPGSTDEPSGNLPA